MIFWNCRKLNKYHFRNVTILYFIKCPRPKPSPRDLCCTPAQYQGGRRVKYWLLTVQSKTTTQTIPSSITLIKWRPQLHFTISDIWDTLAFDSPQFITGSTRSWAYWGNKTRDSPPKTSYGESNSPGASISFQENWSSTMNHSLQKLCPSSTLSWLTYFILGLTYRGSLFPIPNYASD